MEGDDHEAAAFAQQVFRRGEGFCEFAELVVHEDAQRLEGAGGGVNPVAAAKDTGAQVRELFRGLEWAVSDDSAGDGAGFALFAKGAQDVGDVAHIGAVDDVGRGGALPLAAHAHIERAVVAKGKSAIGLIELEG